MPRLARWDFCSHPTQLCNWCFRQFWEGYLTNMADGRCCLFRLSAPESVFCFSASQRRFGCSLPAASLMALREETFRPRSEEHTSELQSLAYLVCRLLLEKKK